MTTVDRRYPTYRQLLEALKDMREEDLDLSITYYDETGDRYYPAILSYANSKDSASILGQEDCFHPIIKIGQEIGEDELIKYDIVCEYGEIHAHEKTYPEVVKWCKKENVSIVSFDKEPDASGCFYVYITGFWPETQIPLAE